MNGNKNFHRNYYCSHLMKKMQNFNLKIALYKRKAVGLFYNVKISVVKGKLNLIFSIVKLKS